LFSWSRVPLNNTGRRVYELYQDRLLGGDRDVFTSLLRACAARLVGTVTGDMNNVRRMFIFHRYLIQQW